MEQHQTSSQIFLGVASCVIQNFKLELHPEDKSSRATPSTHTQLLYIITDSYQKHFRRNIHEAIPNFLLQVLAITIAIHNI